MTAPMTRLPVLVLLVCVPLVLVSLGGCASDGQVDDVTASPIQLLEADKKAAEQEKLDGICRHVWRAVEFHPYTSTSTGIPFTDLCTVQRCDKCGATRHECARQARRR